MKICRVENGSVKTLAVNTKDACERQEKQKPQACPNRENMLLPDASVLRMSSNAECAQARVVECLIGEPLGDSTHVGLLSPFSTTLMHWAS